MSSALFIATTHVGSLPRSDALTPFLLARDRGEDHDVDAFEATVTNELADAVRRQLDAGVTVISDGELSKVGYSTYVTDRLDGFGDAHIERQPARDLAAHPDLAGKLSALMGKQEFRRLACVAPIRLRNLEPLHADLARFNRVLDALPERPRAFMNAASPGLITAFQPNRYYDTHEAYLADLVAAMRPEYQAIIDAGFDLQLDCPDLAMARHTGFQSLSEDEFVARAEANVDALNAATDGLPAERLRMHVCWGNYEGPHDHDVALSKILCAVLRARPDTILFEAANPRHEHEWTVWRDAEIPDTKVLAPGVIDTCSNYIEHPELVAQRLERLAAIVGVDRVMASTDCGFGTFAGYGKIDPGVAWKKLTELRAGADLAAQRSGAPA